MTTNTAIQTDRFYPANKMEYSVPTPESMFKYARVSGEYEWLLADVPEDERAEAIERLKAQDEADKEARKEKLKKARRYAKFVILRSFFVLSIGIVLALVFPDSAIVWLSCSAIAFSCVLNPILDAVDFLRKTRHCTFY